MKCPECNGELYLDEGEGMVHCENEECQFYDNVESFIDDLQKENKRLGKFYMKKCTLEEMLRENRRRMRKNE